MEPGGEGQLERGLEPCRARASGGCRIWGHQGFTLSFRQTSLLSFFPAFSPHTHIFVSIGPIANHLKGLLSRRTEDMGLLLGSPVPASLGLLLLPSSKTSSK